MSHQEPHAHLPLTAYEGRPYDWSLPYDWEIEGDFAAHPVDSEPAEAYPYNGTGPFDWHLERALDGAAEPEVEEEELSFSRRALKNLADVAIIGTGAIVTVLALHYGAYQFKKDFLSVNPGNVPGKLPPKVGSKVDSAVEVGYNGSGGSGVKIGPNLVLTAGHVAAHPFYCVGAYTLNANTYGFHDRDHVMSKKALHNADTDIAMLRVQRYDYAFQALPTARIAEAQPDKGEPVFFVNYETGGSGNNAHDLKELSLRYPNTWLADYMDNKGEKEYGNPAEYAGIVVGHQGSFLIVATGEQSYGPKAGSELNTHPGASGGPVFNSKGELIGLSVASGPESTEGITLDYGVNLSGSERQLTWIQPVTKDLVHQLVNELPPRPPESTCF